MQGFHHKVQLLAADDRHIRYVPGALARSMVESGAASVANRNGKVRAVKLVETGALIRIGEPSAPSLGVRFTRWVRLDASGTRVIEHHPRCLYE